MDYISALPRILNGRRRKPVCDQCWMVGPQIQFLKHYIIKTHDRVSDNVYWKSSLSNDGIDCWCKSALYVAQCFTKWLKQLKGIRFPCAVPIMSTLGMAYKRQWSHLTQLLLDYYKPYNDSLYIWISKSKFFVARLNSWYIFIM